VVGFGGEEVGVVVAGEVGTIAAVDGAAEVGEGFAGGGTVGGAVSTGARTPARMPMSASSGLVSKTSP
jgi:hypothetical protein